MSYLFLYQTTKKNERNILSKITNNFERVSKLRIHEFSLVELRVTDWVGLPLDFGVVSLFFDKGLNLDPIGLGLEEPIRMLG